MRSETIVLMRSTMWGFMMITGSDSQRVWHSRLHCTRQSNHCRSLLLQPINRTVLCLATFALYKLSNSCHFLIHNWMRTNGMQIKDLRFQQWQRLSIHLCFDIHLKTAWQWHFPTPRTTLSSPYSTTPNTPSTQIRVYLEI